METCMGGDVTAIVLTRAKQENMGGEKTERVREKKNRESAEKRVLTCK